MKNVVIVRTAALGDVICTTPVVRRMRLENPDANIVVNTMYPDVFRRNPDASAINFTIDDSYDVVSLDLAYEKDPHTHIVEAYMMKAFGSLGDPHMLQPQLFYPRGGLFPDKKKYIAVHAAQAGWSNRTLPRSLWKKVIDGLKGINAWPILVGTARDDIPNLDVTRFHTPDILAQARLIASCACFIGSDSSLLHVAAATPTPIVGVFTSVHPEMRMPYRNGILGYMCKAVQPDMPCVGCLSRQPAPVTTESCERGDNACVRMVDPDQIIDAAVQLMLNWP